MINILILLLLLILASYTDWKKKIVPNEIILIGLGIGFLLNVNNFGFMLVNFFLGAGIFIGLWKLGGFGGGDSKIFLMITLFFESILQTLSLFVLTGIIFVFYNIITRKQEKRLVPFILTALILQIILYILLGTIY